MPLDVAHQFRGEDITDGFVGDLLRTRVAVPLPSRLPAEPGERRAANIPTVATDKAATTGVLKRTVSHKPYRSEAHAQSPGALR